MKDKDDVSKEKTEQVLDSTVVIGGFMGSFLTSSLASSGDYKKRERRDDLISYEY